MGWRSLLFSIAYLVACAFGAWAQTAASDTRVVTPATLRSNAAQSASTSAADPAPRYSAQIAPTRDVAPQAAPTTRVTQSDLPRYAQPASTQPAAAQPAAAQAQQPPQRLEKDPLRYSAQDSDVERITVSALRGSQDGLYRLGTGDKLRVTVFNEPDLSGEFTIDGQGFVRFPLMGQIQAAGLTSFGLESRIAEQLAGGGYLVNPRVAVDIITYRPFYILGEVAKPGEYAYVNAMSAPNAIALAGGYTDRAVTSSIYIRHQGETKEHEMEADESTPILPGDVVRVRRTTYWTVMTWLSPIISPFATVAYLLK